MSNNVSNAEIVSTLINSIKTQFTLLARIDADATELLLEDLGELAAAEPPVAASAAAAAAAATAPPDDCFHAAHDCCHAAHDCQHAADDCRHAVDDCHHDDGGDGADHDDHCSRAGSGGGSSGGDCNCDRGYRHDRQQDRGQ
jgi:hypothetical protein